MFFDAGIEHEIILQYSSHKQKSGAISVWIRAKRIFRAYRNAVPALACAFIPCSGSHFGMTKSSFISSQIASLVSGAVIEESHPNALQSDKATRNECADSD